MRTMDTTPYKEKLETELAALTTELNELGVENPAVSGDWVTTGDGEPTADPNDVGDRTEEYNARRAALAALETRYRNITRALDKIASGTYGICEISGEAIEADRLEANPAARTCKAHLEGGTNLPTD